MENKKAIAKVAKLSSNNDCEIVCVIGGVLIFMFLSVNASG